MLKNLLSSVHNELEFEPFTFLSWFKTMTNHRAITYTLFSVFNGRTT